MRWLTELSPGIPFSRKLDASIHVFREFVDAWSRATSDPLVIKRARAERGLDAAIRGHDCRAGDVIALLELATAEGP